MSFPIEKRLIEEKAMRRKLFCKDLVSSMKHWNIGAEFKLNIPDNIFEGNFQDFITNLRGYLETFNYAENCDCIRDRKNPNSLAPSFNLQ